jgi:2,4-dienoyl-CoA reductase-like NADH-dependent reductase (Old Yellow Enzyme family)/thioredoxin reductase
MSHTALEPFTLGRITLPNRIVFGAVSSLMEDRNGHVTDVMEAFFTRRAEGGAGLVTLGIGSVTPNVKIVKRQLALYDDSVIPGLASLTNAVHSRGSKVAVQLHHAGRLAVPGYNGGRKPKGPSSIKGKLDMFGAPDELATAEIEEIIKAYGRAAVRVAEAGVDVLEVHAAHGHGLPQQFLSPYSNQRTDEWGGSPDNRSRFLREVIATIRDEVGNEVAVCLRLSADEDVEGGLDATSSRKIISSLEDCGFDAISVSAGNYDSRRPIAVQPPSMPHLVLAELASALRSSTSLPLGVAGRILDRSDIDAVFERGIGDFVVLVRALIADPDMPKKLASAKPVRSCVGSMWCLRDVRIGRGIECAVNAEVGHEAEVGWEPPTKTVAPGGQRTAVIVGGGVAGMEAARVLAGRGHRVHLLEANDYLGGQIAVSAHAVAKEEHKLLVDYLVSELERLGVILHLGVEATLDLITAAEPSAVILATGSAAILAAVAGLPAERRLLAVDVIRGLKLPDAPAHVLVSSGDGIGCDAAEALARRGHEVTVVERSRRIGSDIEAFTRREQLVTRFRQLPVTLISEAHVESWSEDGFDVRKSDGSAVLVKAQFLVTGIHRQPDSALYSEVREAVPEVIVVGDAVKAPLSLAGLHDAIQSGYLGGLGVLPTTWN